MTAHNTPPRNWPALRWKPERPRPLIANGRVYRWLDRHYAVRRRLLPQMWKGPLVEALIDARRAGLNLRTAVAHLYRELRRTEKGEQCTRS